MPARAGHSPVLSVGRRVFVNGRDGVVLTDEAGRSVSQRLPDGAEVEIVAWRPRGGAGTRYRVRSMLGDAAGWVGADELRPTRHPVETPAPTPASTAEPRPESGRKFGQRR